MATQSNTKTAEDIVERVQNLCRQAQSDNENEARTAALLAVRLMNEHELSFVPKAELDKAMKAIEGAQVLAKQAKAENTKNMLLGGLIGAFVGKKFL
jgi:hypothetical protein